MYRENYLVWTGNLSLMVFVIKKKYKNCGVMDVDERKCEISHKHPGHLLEEIQDVKIDYLHINKILE